MILYLTQGFLGNIKAFSSPPPRQIQHSTGRVMFLHGNPITELYNLNMLLPVLKLGPGSCIKVEITWKEEDQDKITLIVKERDVFCKTELI